MKKQFAFICATLLLLVGCSQQDEPLNHSGSSPAEELTAENYVPLTEAIDIAKSHIASLEGGHGTRARALSPTGIQSIGKMLTRGVTEDSTSLWGYHIINFDDNAGFAIVSADRRNPLPLYAVSDDGNFSMTEAMENPGLASYMAALPGIGLDSITGWGPNRPPIDIIIPQPTYRREVILAPMLADNVRTWSENEPFNSQCEIGSGNQRFSLGCSAVATGMIMSYYKWPASYKGVSYNWDNMIADHNSSDLAKFLKALGNEENLDLIYQPETVVTTNTEAYKRTFANMGYKEPSVTTFSEATALTHLRENQPLLIYGSHSTTSSSRFHVWVLDGIYMAEYPTVQIVPPPSGKDTFYYLHTVWCKGGTNNGYYNYSGGKISGSPDYAGSGESYSGSIDTYSSLKYFYGFTKK